MKEGTSSNFNDLIKEGVVVVDFFATWCGPCRMLSPVLEELSSDRNQTSFVKIDIDLNPDLAKNYSIMSVPTLLLFKDGKLVDKKNGYLPKELLTEWISKF